MKKLILLLLLFVQFAFSQITFNGCPNYFGNQNFIFTSVGTDATGRNIYETTPIIGDQPCPGIGACEFRISWNNASSRWEFLADDGNGNFSNPYLIYYNTSASTPNPPSLSLGVWIENTASTLGDCAGNLTTGNSVLTGSVQNSLTVCNISLLQNMQTNIACNGASTGAASVNNATGGTAPYTYNWTPGTPTGDGTTSVTGLTAGTWTCTVTDANGCIAARTFTITQPSALALTAASQTNISCYGGSNGAASINIPTGGVAPYSYNWTPGNPSGDGTASVTGLTGGTYTVTVTDANGCTATKGFTITQPTFITTTGSITDVSCNGGSNGSATVTPSGGTAPYTYSWSPSGGTAATATGLTGGFYTVTVTDANGCTATHPFYISQPDPLAAFAANQTNVSCSGGSNGTAQVVASGGTAGYTYNWTPGNPTGDGTTTVTGLTAGTWTCTVTDVNGCTTTRNFTITQPFAFTADIVQTDVSCNGGSDGTATVFTFGGGGNTYSWSPSGGTGATASGLSAGTYTCTITSSNGCTTTKSVTITQPAALTADIVQTNVSCNGGSNGNATVIPFGGGGYSFSWSPSGATGVTAFDLSAGTYICTITSSTGCTTTKSVTITQPDVLTVISEQTNISCNGDSNGTATVNASGGTAPYFYSWFPSGGTGATASGLSAGTYTCTITDANACSITQNFILTQPSVITATSTQTNETCNGNADGSATVFPAGGTPGYTYLWSNGMITPTVTGLAAGTYTCTITDAVGCTTTQSVTITQPSSMTVDAGPATVTYCADAIMPITATATTAPATSNGFQGTYAPTNWTFENISADGNVNTTNAPASITITGGDNFSNSEGNTTYSITFATNTTVSFNWAYSTIDDAGADYPQVIVNGVASTFQDYSIFGSNNQSGTMAVNLLAGQTFAFNMFTVDNGGGVGVVIISDLVITNSDVSYSWAATNGGSITGATNTANMTPATSGTYTVTATNGAGCTATDSVAVTVNTTPAPTASAQTFCNSATVASLVATGTSLQWYNVATGGTVLASTTALATGSYYVSQTLNTCESTRTAVSVSIATSSTRIYVNASNATSGDGSSWATAMTNIQEAINTCGAQEVWVAMGTYKPTQDPFGNSAPTDARDKTFYLKNGVKVYGGFMGNETTLTQRNAIINTTILSGDIGTANDTSDNAYHVVLSVNDDATTMLDGFTITGGNANATYIWTNSIVVEGKYIAKFYGGGVHNNYSTASYANLILSSNYAFRDGGGMYGDHSSTSVNKCVFINNSVEHYGGGMSNYYSSNAIITNSVFVANTSAFNGGAMDNDMSLPIVTNVTVYNNHAVNMGGGIANCGPESAPTLTNCIIYGNTAGMMDPQYHDESNLPTYNYCVIEGGHVGTGNTSNNPSFVNSANAIGADNKWMTADDGLALSCNSNAFNTGTNTGVPATDILGVARPLFGTSDIGAYESNINLITPAPTGTASQTFCTGETVSLLNVTGTGVIWHDASTAGNVMAGTTALVSGTTYYASQTVNGCESPTRLAVTATSGACLGTESFDNNKFSFYPNPTSNVLNIEHSKNIEGVSVINLLGQIMFENKTNNTNVQIDLSNLPTATYFVKVKAEGNEKTVKVIKQ